MTLSGFRTTPRQGHLDCARRAYGYLAKMKAELKSPIILLFRNRTSSAGVREIELNDAAEALGKYVTLTHYADANLFHDIITGSSVTGILHLVNKTPIAWYSKKQATVETAAYGSEYVAARTCVGQVMYLRLTLRYLGVSIHSRSYMCFGDNKTVVESSI
jgi:hypothetical protein